MTTATSLTYEQQCQIAKFAQADMRLARKEGEIAIAQTKVGTVFLAYDKATRTYSLTPANRLQHSFPALRKLAAAGCETRLAAVYDVCFED
jgi:hypothetical protein